MVKILGKSTEMPFLKVMRRFGNIEKEKETLDVDRIVHLSKTTNKRRKTIALSWLIFTDLFSLQIKLLFTNQKYSNVITRVT